MNVLVKLPTRERSEKFQDVVSKLAALWSSEHDVRVLVACDDDDTDMNPFRWSSWQPEVKVREGCPNSFLVEYVSKDHTSKIDACNSFLPGEWPWHVIVMLSDDMVPVKQDWDAIICADLVAHFPDLDGIAHYNDGHVGERCCTLPIMGRTYYDRFGYVYEPGYKSLWCDQEYTEVARMLSCHFYSEVVLFDHNHPGTVGCPSDDLYDRNNKLWVRDKDYYNGREVRKFDVPILDILICSIPTREDLLANLLENLNKQIKEANLTTNVGIIIERDSKRMRIGTKRNAMIMRSRAEYVAHIDDDDQVSEDYVTSIIEAIGKCDVDCVAIIGRLRFGGAKEKNWRKFIHSIRYDRYEQLADGTYVRPPNHLNPIKRKFVLRYPFKDVTHAEDTDFSLRLCRQGVLKTERLAAKTPIYSYIPSSWWANRMGRCDGHAAYNTSADGDLEQLEQDRRADNLPPEAIDVKVEEKGDVKSDGKSIDSEIDRIAVGIVVNHTKRKCDTPPPPPRATSGWTSESGPKAKLRRMREMQERNRQQAEQKNDGSA